MVFHPFQGLSLSFDLAACGFGTSEGPLWVNCGGSRPKIFRSDLLQTGLFVVAGRRAVGVRAAMRCILSVRGDRRAGLFVASSGHFRRAGRRAVSLWSDWRTTSSVPRRRAISALPRHQQTKDRAGPGWYRFAQKSGISVFGTSESLLL